MFKFQLCTFDWYTNITFYWKCLFKYKTSFKLFLHIYLFSKNFYLPVFSKISYFRQNLEEREEQQISKNHPHAYWINCDALLLVPLIIRRWRKYRCWTGSYLIYLDSETEITPNYLKRPSTFGAFFLGTYLKVQVFTNQRKCFNFLFDNSTNSNLIYDINSIYPK